MSEHLPLRHPRTLAAVTLAALLAACGSSTPTTPTAAFGQGVTLYPDSLFRGER
ncbi:MAG: hypothetical protein ABJC89_21685 [Acidobacteriota bacterium]